MHPRVRHHHPINLRRSTKSSSSFPLWFIPLGLIFLIILGFIVYIKHQPGIWNGKERITLAIIQDDTTALLSYDPGWDKAVWLPFPKDFQISTLSYGEYPISSVWKLGEQEKIGGGHLIAKSLQWALGIGVDGYLNSSHLPFSVSPNSPHLFSRTFRTITFLLSPRSTNLSLWDSLSLAWHLSGLRPDKIDFINIETATVGKRSVLADGEESYEIKPNLFQSRLKLQFIDSQIQNQNLPVVIINHTTISGLAAKAAQIVSNSGAQVAKAETGDSQNLTGCRVSVSPEHKNSSLVRKITLWFGCDQELIDKQNFIGLSLFSLDSQKSPS